MSALPDNDGFIEIEHNGQSIRMSPESWHSIFRNAQEMKLEIIGLKRELARCKPDEWLEQARKEIAEKAEEASRARAECNGVARGVMSGQSQAYRDTLGILKTYAS